MDPRDFDGLKPLKTRARLDAAGLTQAPDQRNPDEFAQPFTDIASDIAEYAAVYPEDDDPSPKMLKQAVGHVNAMGATVRFALRTIATKQSTADKVGACQEIARRVVLRVKDGDAELEAQVVRFLLLCSTASVW